MIIVINVSATHPALFSVNKNDTSPEAFAEINPVFVIEAIFTLELIHVPNALADNNVLSPTQMLSLPKFITVGVGFMVIISDGSETQRLSFINDMVTVPIPTAVTSPIAFIVAIVVSLLTHIPISVDIKVVDSPSHI